MTVVFNDFKGANECPRCGQRRMDGVRSTSIKDGSTICSVCVKDELVDDEGIEMDPHSGIKWKTPPGAPVWAPGMPMKGQIWIRAMLASLEENPGKWALVRETTKKNANQKSEWNRKYGERGFEFVSHPNEVGGYDIYGIYDQRTADGELPQDHDDQ